MILAGNHVSVDAAGLKGRKTGLNFLYVTPAYVSYHKGPLHLLWGPSVFIPAAKFDKQDLANVTNNHFSYNNEVAITYMPHPRLEISLENVTTFNARNKATKYKSGTLTNTDFGINFAPIADKPNIFFGLNGFFAKQLSDDKVDGQKIGNRLTKLGVGPQVIYYPKPGVGILAKWQSEVISRNSAKGDRFWIQFTMPI